MSLDAGPSSDKSKAHWRIRRGKSGTGNEHGSLFAAQATATPAEGWAHVMDRSRCTAAAVADFGRSGADQIRVAASGALDMTRHFPDARERTGGAKERKTLRFWLHFVTNPVQIGAVTSPQAMLAPLDVTWLSEVR